MSKLFVYNSLTRQKELFQPINPPFVGLYLCGPTVYGEPHLGHARPAVTFDVVYRYLKHSGYKVRFVRNITDVGHLVNDADEGEDKIAQKARVEQLEPMEVAQHYTNKYHEAMQALNVLPPGIEPRASGHIPEQIKMIEEIIANGYAYEVNGSVYFDVLKYNSQHQYGKLSGRVVEELEAGAGNERRNLEGQDEKRSANDFALWKKASPEHIMQWDSPWGKGFPGWHIECSAMSSKYLGQTFDIHGGGMDLLFPHHECEIAQSVGSCGKEPVRYWMHNNMITINGQKMGKSLGNAVNLEQFFTGSHPLLKRGYSPMTIRYFILQAHYRSTLDFSNEALQAAEKAYKKLVIAHKIVNELYERYKDVKISDVFKEENETISNIKDLCKNALDEDFNTAIVLSHLHQLTSMVNIFRYNNLASSIDWKTAKEIFDTFFINILGLSSEEEKDNGVTDGLMQLLIEIRNEARAKKDYATTDKVRDELKKIGVQLKDGKEGTEWSYL
jgi:cysteinyl-tRNA synthetase